MSKAKDYEPMTADQLVAFRTRHKLTQEALAAEVLKCSVKSVMNYEQGQRKIPDWVPNCCRMYARVQRLEDKLGNAI